MRVTGKDLLRLSFNCPVQPIELSKFMERGIPSTGKPCNSPIRKLVIHFGNHTISGPSRVDLLAFAVGPDFGSLIYIALGFTAGFIVASALACSFCCCTLWVKDLRFGVTVWRTLSKPFRKSRDPNQPGTEDGKSAESSYGKTTHHGGVQRDPDCYYDNCDD